MRFVACLLAAAATLLIAVPAGSQSIEKLSTRAKKQLAAQSVSSLGEYWLFVDRSAVDSQTVYLTEAARKRRARVDPSSLLIDAHDFPIRQAVVDSVRGAGVEVLSVSKWLRAIAVAASPEEIVSAEVLPFVKQIDVVTVYERAKPANSPRIKPEPHPQAQALDYGYSAFQLAYMNAMKLQLLGLSGKGVRIAMFDSGFDIHHPAFDSTNIIETYDFINSDTTVDEVGCDTTQFKYPPDYQTYHGTLTLGALGGYVPGALIGAAYGADYLLAKTEITCGGTEVKIEEYNWIAAAEWADSLGADIISSSLGYTTFQDSGSYTPSELDGKTALITKAAEIAASKNILVVNSAGNDRANVAWPHISFPADGDSVLAVGATTPDSSLAAFSSPGPTADGRIKPDVANFGENVYTAYQFGGYTRVGGTSLSAPLTAGAAALAFEYDPTLTAAEYIQRVRETASQPNAPDNDFGYGIVNAADAAGLLKLDLPDTLTVAFRDTIAVDVRAVGTAPELPTITLIDPPSWALFDDNGDGTGLLRIIPSNLSGVGGRLGFTLSYVDIVDTDYVVILLYGQREADVFAGPNPFAESVNIYTRASAGRVNSISIHNIAGEIVWEEVNKSAPSADTVTVTKWNGRNQSGEIVAAGVYIAVVDTDRRTYHVKLLKSD
ncbi:MAG TPA: S8 family peptidase [candidate division Zixibacteria bacterium]|nr:S8 family peptidase [candidate division Zixibacteria bacterium]